MKKQYLDYDLFVRGALSRGFTDDQVDFLWDIFAEYKPDFRAPQKP